MDKTEHTPGPWSVVRSVTCGHLRAGHNYRSDARLEWTDADLNLIEAAPEMLAALKRLCDTKDDDVLLSWAAARAAISKAIGGSNGA